MDKLLKLVPKLVLELMIPGGLKIRLKDGYSGSKRSRCFDAVLMIVSAGKMCCR